MVPHALPFIKSIKSTWWSQILLSSVWRSYQDVFAANVRYFSVKKSEIFPESVCTPEMYLTRIRRLGVPTNDWPVSRHITTVMSRRTTRQ